MTEQNWATVVVELVVVVVGIFLGLQATAWHEERQERADGIYYLDLLHRQLDDEIRMMETDLAEHAERIGQIRTAYQLLHANSWSEEEYDRFKADHTAMFSVPGVSRRPSALRQLLDNGKIDLIESREIQEMMFSLDRAYDEAIGQSEISRQRLGDSTMAVTEEIPYGTADNLMAIPVQPDVLLASDRLRTAVRITFIMNMIQRNALEALQTESIQARDDLERFLSSRSSLAPDRSE